MPQRISCIPNMFFFSSIVEFHLPLMVCINHTLLTQSLPVYHVDSALFHYRYQFVIHF